MSLCELDIKCTYRVRLLTEMCFTFTNIHLFISEEMSQNFGHVTTLMHISPLNQK